MPLSKARDRVRKKKERAKIRLDKLLCPPQTLKPVQPKGRTVKRDGPGYTQRIDVDADGNPVPEVT